MDERFDKLVWLSREIGREDRELAILGEGNCSIKIDDTRFAVKASGCSLATLSRDNLVLCDTKKVLALMDQQGLEGPRFEAALMDCRADQQAKCPSVETPFHGWLMQMEGVLCVAHCHPIACTTVLCSARAEEYATRRLFPDEILCCGAQSVFVPYADPGISLAREIRTRVLLSMRRSYGKPPRLILLQNHGIIAVGTSPEAALATILMAEKAARVLMGAASMGGAVFLPTHQAQRFETRPDEAYRQRLGRL